MSDIPYVRFTEEAQSVFDKWRERLELHIRSGKEHPAIEAHLSKYRSLVPSIALLIQLADYGKGSVQLEPLQKAIGWAEYLESHARRIYAQVINPGPSAAHALANRILDGDLADGFTLKDVYRPCWSGLASKSEAESAVGVLIGLNWLAEQHQRTPGRTKTVFRIHPEILNRVRKKPDTP